MTFDIVQNGKYMYRHELDFQISNFAILISKKTCKAIFNIAVLVVLYFYLQNLHQTKA